jgi:hypothetical protein
MNLRLGMSLFFFACFNNYVTLPTKKGFRSIPSLVVADHYAPNQLHIVSAEAQSAKKLFHT